MSEWMSGCNEQLPWAETHPQGALSPPTNPARVGLSEPAVTCRMEPYLAFRFLIEVVSWSSSGIGYNQQKGKTVWEGQAWGWGGEEGTPGGGGSQASLRTSQRLSVAGTTPSRTLTTVIPLPAVATGNQGPPVP